ncbi:MAG: RNA methyltransferase [Quisquiliibacterium sp.]
MSRTSVVLVQPSHPGNVGAAARAMRVMGLERLVLVEPRDPGAVSHADALAFASGATDLLRSARLVSTLDEALAEVSLAIAVSADAREFGPAPMAPEDAARAALEELARDQSHTVALVFGTERTGLSIDQVARCQLLCSIPGEPGYHSLNLSQAVQVISYVMRREALLLAGQAPGSSGRAPQTGAATGGTYASQAAIEALFDHWQRALLAIGFLDPAHPKKLMPRLRRLFSRTRLEVEEVDLLRGICKMTEQAGRENPPAWFVQRDEQSGSQ